MRLQAGRRFLDLLILRRPVQVTLMQAAGSTPAGSVPNGKEVFMENKKTTKTREMIKIMKALEALGYQVDSIEMQPETGFYLDQGHCLINIKASPLIEIKSHFSKSPEKE